MKTKISSKGRIVVPVEFRKQDQVLPGQRFEVVRIDEGQYLLKRVATQDNVGVVDWLLACPSGDWFHPLPPGATEDISRRYE